MSKSATLTPLWIALLTGISICFMLIAWHQVSLSKASIFRIGVERVNDLRLEREVEGISLYLADHIKNWRKDGEVPEIFAQKIPPGVLQAEQPTEWKRRFLASLTPIVLKVNDLILQDRQRLQNTFKKRAKGEKLSSLEKMWLEKISDHYGVSHEEEDALLRRIDSIPPSLVLAQAAIESAWGRSRFAKKGNALFGQWTWGGEGIVPERRVEGASHKIRKFDSLAQSVYAYYHNLNTHRAYRKFRQERAQQRQNGGHLDALQLANTLDSYSERGAIYPQEVRAVIRINRLQDFDTAMLQKTGLRS